MLYWAQNNAALQTGQPLWAIAPGACIAALGRGVRPAQLRVRRDRQPGPAAGAEEPCQARAALTDRARATWCLEVRDLSVDYAMDRGAVARGRRRQLRPGPRASSSASSASPAAASPRCCSRSPSCSPRPPTVTGGSVTFKGRSLVGLTDRQLTAVRWRDLSVVMQSAMNALNPVKSIGAQFTDAMRAHGVTSKKEIAGPVRRGAQDGRHRPGAPEELPAPAVRRHAAAVHDRDGPAVHPGPGHHGRAHLGAGRGGAAAR